MFGVVWETEREIGVNMIKMLCAHIKLSMDKGNIL